MHAGTSIQKHHWEGSSTGRVLHPLRENRVQVRAQHTAYHGGTNTALPEVFPALSRAAERPAASLPRKGGVQARPEVVIAGQGGERPGGVAVPLVQEWGEGCVHPLGALWAPELLCLKHLQRRGGSPVPEHSSQAAVGSQPASRCCPEACPHPTQSTERQSRDSDRRACSPAVGTPLPLLRRPSGALERH